jgi:hypothetical protein
MWRFAQVGVEGGKQCGFGRHECVVQLAEMRAAELQRLRPAGLKEGALASDSSGEIHNQLGGTSSVRYS